LINFNLNYDVYIPNTFQKNINFISILNISYGK